MVFFSISLVEIFFIEANFSIVCIIYEGSLDLPLNGIGARYGESVSTSNLFKGIMDTASLISVESLKVTIPLIEI